MANENETVEQVCETETKSKLQTYNDKDRLIGFCQRIIASHKREMAAKDAEIDDLKAKNTEAFKAVLKSDKEIRDSNTLIKELADALNSYLIGECIDCGKRCEGDDVCDHQKNLRALVAKAREVVNV